MLDKKFSPDETRSHITRIWSLIPQPRNADSSGSCCRARLTAVDSTLPSCELYDGASVLFGRSEKCAVRIADVTVSHEHCRVYIEDKKVFLEDLSTHGTFVNRQKIGHRMHVQLQHGDAVWLSKAAIKSKTQHCHFVVHMCGQLETRILQFPSAFVTNSSETPKVIEQTSKRTGEKFLLNVRTGKTQMK